MEMFMNYLIVSFIFGGFVAALRFIYSQRKEAYEYKKFEIVTNEIMDLASGYKLDVERFNTKLSVIENDFFKGESVIRKFSSKNYPDKMVKINFDSFSEDFVPLFVNDVVIYNLYPALRGRRSRASVWNYQELCEPLVKIKPCTNIHPPANNKSIGNIDLINDIFAVKKQTITHANLFGIGNGNTYLNAYLH